MPAYMPSQDLAWIVLPAAQRAQYQSAPESRQPILIEMGAGESTSWGNSRWKTHARRLTDKPNQQLQHLHAVGVAKGSQAEKK